MIDALPPLWLPSKPAIIRAADAPRWRDEARDLLKRSPFAGTFPFPFMPAAAAVTYPTWNPSDKNAGITLSNANKTAATGSSSGNLGRATGGRSSGKVYVEGTVDTAGAGGLFGVADASASTSNYLGVDTHGWAYYRDGRTYYNNVASSYGVSLNNADVLGMAIDFATGKIWWAVNNTWQNSGNPASGTNAAYSSVTGTVMVAIGTASNNHQITVNWGETAFVYTPPSGFSAWSNP